MIISGKKNDKKQIVTAVIIITVVIILFITVATTKVGLEGETLIISGIYGMNVDVQSITDVYTEDQLPKNLKRNNGMDFFKLKLIGNFSSPDLGNIKMLVQNSKGPYIYVMLQNSKFDYIIISNANTQETLSLYEQIKNEIGK